MDGDTGGYFIELILDSEIIDSVVSQVTTETVKAALILAATFYGLSFGWNYLKTGFDRMTTGKPGPPIDLQHLAKSIVLILFIVSYKPIISVADSYMMYINSLSSPSKNQMTAMGANFVEVVKKTELDSIIKTTRVHTKEGKTAKEALTMTVKNQIYNMLKVSNPAWWMEMSVFWILKTITVLMKGIIGSIAAFIFKFMLIVGPLAAAFSILPFQTSKLEEWAGTTLGAGMVYTSFNILDHFQFYIWEVIAHAPEKEFMTGLSAMQVCGSVLGIITVLYTMTFWLTSKYAGKADGGRIAGKILSAAVTAVAAGAGAAAGAAAAGGGGGAAGGGGKSIAQNVSSAAEKSKDAFKDEE